MDRKIRATQLWPLWLRILAAAVAIVVAYLVQIPLERQVPGEPFLLFFMVVISTTLAFGSSAGFTAVGLSTLLSIPFFEPMGSLVAFTHAWDLVKIELYALLSSACVIGFARLRQTLIAVSERKEALQRQDESKSLLLKEAAHAVANNFAAVAAILSMKAGSVGDRDAKRMLDEAVEQVKVMARVHRRLRACDNEVSLDSAEFIRELCDDLAKMARGRQISVEREADSSPLSMETAVLVGLILNELVTNAIKHAFPDGRTGHIRVRFAALNPQLHLSVSDDGVGFDRCAQRGDAGLGQELVRGLSRELGGDLKIESTTSGSTFCVTFPCSSQEASRPAPALLN